MEASFPAMMKVLKNAAYKLVLFRSLVPQGKEDELAGTLSCLHTRLRQLEGVLYIKFPFGENQAGDIIQYALRIEENETECAEKIAFMLSSNEIFDTNNYKYDIVHLQEVLSGITHNSEVINSMLGAKDRIE